MKSKCRTALVVLSAAVALTALSAAPALASGKPVVESKAATAIGETTATLHGVVNPNGAETKYWFDYGTTRSYGTKTAEASAGSGGTLEESQVITGLAPGTIYYFHIVAKNVNGTVGSTEEVFTTPAKPGLPEFVPKAGSKGETFPLAIETTTSRRVTFDAAFYAAPVSCAESKLTGSVTAAKTVSLTYSVKACQESTGEKGPCTSFAISGTGSLMYLDKATKRVGIVLPLARHTVLCGVNEELYRGTLISPITPINSETTKPEMRYYASGGDKNEVTEYENEKGEKVATKFEWNTSGSLWEAASLEAGIGNIVLTAPRGLTIKA